MKRFQFLTGFLCGALLFGGLTSMASAAAGLTANPTTQTFYVDGRQVQFEAYQIHGNNFVKLRDIGKAVDFGVEYHAADNSVHLDPSAPYAEEPPALTTPDVLTEAEVEAAIRALRDIYPSRTYYGSFYRSTSNGPYGSTPSNCAGWATLCSDAAFGNLPWRRVVNPRWEDIRSGDLVRYDNHYGGHVVVVLNKTSEYIKVTESGTDNKSN